MKNPLRKEKKYSAKHTSHVAWNSKAKATDSTKIFKGIRLVGQVEGDQDFYLNGELEGKINTSALVTIGENGRFKGELKAKNVIIAGAVEGKINAEERVEITESGGCRGDITSPSVLISDQAYFQGNVTMVRVNDKASLQDITPQKTKAPKKLKENKNDTKPGQEIKVVHTNVQQPDPDVKAVPQY
ncbi:MAG: polymer-forming cytoskeletal protein [bacterium]